ncbi:MAG TPA: class I SAM-dependent methyltransferase [Burkholderiales bacterium]|nr:class I SAM-dependent methyltransferase [Burkholderiales bacterium]
MQRCVEPEWLDELSPEDPRAIRSRRDMQRVNIWMHQVGIMQRALTGRYGQYAPHKLLELGAGDGTFMLRLALRLASHWKNVKVVLLDRQNIVSHETREGFKALGWEVETITADAFDYLEQARYQAFDVITANLFLHHFQHEKLDQLLLHAARITNLFVACEPRRALPAVTGSRLLWAIGCNEVSRHDAVVSVRAGFAGQELSALWPKQANWRLREQAAGLFTHCFVAQRIIEQRESAK